MDGSFLVASEFCDRLLRAVVIHECLPGSGGCNQRGAASVCELPSLTASSARARATESAGALWLRANCSRARRSELVRARSGSFFVRLTNALLGQYFETAPEVYRIMPHFGEPG